MSCYRNLPQQAMVYAHIYQSPRVMVARCADEVSAALPSRVVIGIYEHKPWLVVVNFYSTTTLFFSFIWLLIILVPMLVF